MADRGDFEFDCPSLFRLLPQEKEIDREKDDDDDDDEEWFRSLHQSHEGGSESITSIKKSGVRRVSCSAGGLQKENEALSSIGNGSGLCRAGRKHNVVSKRERSESLPSEVGPESKVQENVKDNDNDTEIVPFTRETLLAAYKLKKMKQPTTAASSSSAVSVKEPTDGNCRITKTRVNVTVAHAAKVMIPQSSARSTTSYSANHKGASTRSSRKLALSVSSEPTKIASVANVRKWEKMTGKKYATLSVEEREHVNRIMEASFS